MRSSNAPTFQSTHPRGVRPDGMGCVYQRCYGFNPRTRVGCDIRARPLAAASTCFNPRTRVGCDGLDSKILYAIVKVSIHAPAWGATPPLVSCITTTVVSIHAPAWGATGPAAADFWPGKGFNPRTRVGCDSALLPIAATLSWFQSTHPRGVRPGHGPRLLRLAGGFNPRTRVGCAVRPCR